MRTAGKGREIKQHTHRSDTASLSESVQSFPEEFGRTYHAYRAGCMSFMYLPLFLSLTRSYKHMPSPTMRLNRSDLRCKASASRGCWGTVCTLPLSRLRGRRFAYWTLLRVSAIGRLTWATCSPGRQSSPQTCPPFSRKMCLPTFTSTWKTRKGPVQLRSLCAAGQLHRQPLQCFSGLPTRPGPTLGTSRTSLTTSIHDLPLAAGHHSRRR